MTGKYSERTGLPLYRLCVLYVVYRRVDSFLRYRNAQRCVRTLRRQIKVEITGKLISRRNFSFCVSIRN